MLLIKQPDDDGKAQLSNPAPPAVEVRLIREAQFLNRAAPRDANLMVVQEFETSTGERYAKTFFTAWKGL